MGQRNKDCTLGDLCIEEVVGQKPRAPETIHSLGALLLADVIIRQSLRILGQVKT